MESREEYYETELEQEVVGFNVNAVFDYVLCATLLCVCIVCLVMVAYNIRDCFFRRRLEKITKLWNDKDGR